MQIPARLETPRLLLRLTDPALAEEVAAYQVENRAFLSKTDPQRGEDFYTVEFQRNLLAQEAERCRSYRAARYWFSKKEDPNRIIGMVGLNEIVFGAFQSCFLAYHLSGANVRRGYATEAVRELLRVAFEELGLHRVEANIMPRNLPSLRLAEKLGFASEGVSKEYLKINGVWEDHVHMVLLNRNREE